MIRTIAAMFVAACAIAPPAFGLNVGMVNPSPIPAADSSALGVTMQRYDVVWHGESTFTGSLVVSRATIPVVAAYPANRQYGASMAMAFCAWLGSVLDRYPFVRHVIVGNEPRAGDPDAYGMVAAACVPIVHAHGAMAIGPGMVPAPWDWTQRMLNAIRASGARLDAFDFHPYWYSSAPFDRDVVNRVHRTLGPHVGVWITEDGVQSIYPGFNPWYSVPEPDQATRIADDIVAAKCAGVDVWMNFLLADEPDSGGWQSGVVRTDGTHKPSYDAMAAATRAVRAGAYDCVTTSVMTPGQPRHPHWRGPRCATDYCEGGRFP